jgi:hypothetical protein
VSCAHVLCMHLHIFCYLCFLVPALTLVPPPPPLRRGGGQGRFCFFFQGGYMVSVGHAAASPTHARCCPLLPWALVTASTWCFYFVRPVCRVGCPSALQAGTAAHCVRIARELDEARRPVMECVEHGDSKCRVVGQYHLASHSVVDAWEHVKEPSKRHWCAGCVCGPRDPGCPSHSPLTRLRYASTGTHAHPPPALRVHWPLCVRWVHHLPAPSLPSDPGGADLDSEEPLLFSRAWPYVPGDIASVPGSRLPEVRACATVVGRAMGPKALAL